MKKFKKAVAMIMTLAMTLGVMSFTALAESTSLPDAENGVITLTEDVTYSSNWTVASNESITLDLAGYTFTTTTILVYGELTVKDSASSGKITSVSSIKNGAGMIQVDGGKVTLESGTIENNGTNGYGIYCLNGGTAIVNGGTITSNSAALSGNNTTGDMNFTVTGGTLTAAQGPAIYMPGQVNLTITGGTLNGGISLRMGQVTISGGTINAITDNINSPASYYSYSGNAWLPDALYVFAGTYTSENSTYGNSLNITITGGTFNCENSQGSAVAIYDLGKVEQTAEVEITDGEFYTNAENRSAYDVLSLADIGVTDPASGYNNDAYTGSVDTSITGGEYSTSVAEYVAEGYEYEACNDGTYTYHKTMEDAVEAADGGEVKTVAAAIAEANNESTFTIKFDANGGKISSTGENSLTISAVVEDEIEFPEVSRSGYTLSYWSSDFDSSKYSDTYTVDGENESIEFTAQWTKKSSTTHSSYSLSETTGSSSSSDEDEEDNTTVTTPSTTDTTSTVFADLSTSHPYYDSIMTAYENGWMVGVSSDTFAAEGYLTRAMAAKILHNVADNPEATDVALFLDVPSGEWYSEAIAWAYEQGIVVGYDAQTFGPNDYVTVNQFCIMLAKYKGEEVPEYTGNSLYATRGLIANMITA